MYASNHIRTRWPDLFVSDAFTTVRSCYEGLHLFFNELLLIKPKERWDETEMEVEW